MMNLFDNSFNFSVDGILVVCEKIERIGGGWEMAGRCMLPI